jgi:hypothetical protein
MSIHRHPFSAISAVDSEHYPKKLHDKFKLFNLRPGLHVLRLMLFENELNGCELKGEKYFL